MTIRSAWMWANETGVSGLSIDLEKKRLHWLDEIGCACSDSTFEQTYEAFLAKGSPFYDVPEDVLEEITGSVEALLTE